MLWIPIELNIKTHKNIKHAYKLKFFSPFLSIINKGVKNKTNKNIFFLYSKTGINQGMLSPFCLNSNMIPIKNVSMKCILIPIKNETIPIEFKHRS